MSGVTGTAGAPRLVDTHTKTVHELIPGSKYLLGEWVCARQGSCSTPAVPRRCVVSVFAVQLVQHSRAVDAVAVLKFYIK